MGALDNKVVCLACFSLFVILFSSPNFAACSPASAGEANALFKWKHSLQNQNTSSLASWEFHPNNDSISACRWLGISCNHHGIIKGLNLSNFGINGTLYNFPFSSLSNLKYIDLSINQLFGTIPPEIGSLSKLIYLDLSINSFFGSIPSEIGHLSNLETLHLVENELTGSIPHEIGNLTSLKDLSLYDNNLEGHIPASLGHLKNLSFLYLYENNIHGSIPHQLGDLTNLLELDIDTNNLTGPIPSNLGKLKKLTMLFLHENHLSGSIPLEIGKLKSLEYLSFYSNNLTGSIPTTFGGLTSLTLLHLYGNQLSGPIPQELGKLKSLTDLELSQNNLIGQIPTSFGPIPKSLKNCSTLVRARFDGNKLTGSISEGCVPVELGSLTQISYLDLSKNSLSGSIPRFWPNFQNLFHLNLSRNKFSQEIPFQIGNLFHLNKLDLSHNLLAREIPSDITKLQSLELLNLSHNNLFGVIPKGFEKIPLSFVDISYNNLQGPIPNSKAFIEAPMEALQGNKGLCGNATGLQPCPSSMNSKSRTKHKALVILIPLGGVILFSGALMGYVIMLEWRKRKANVEEGDKGNKDVFSISLFDGKGMYNDILKATENFNAAYCIGNGGFGIVYKANLPSLASYTTTVAVKKLHSLSDQAEFASHKSFLNEIRALTEIRHRNIVKLFGFCSHARHSFLIYEYLERGSLAKLLGKDETARELDWPKRVNIVKGVAHALSYMHHDCSPSIVHRDLSSNNILIDEEYEARISDFGNAKLLKLNSSNWSAIAGTYGYVAPELAYMTKVTAKVDVYGFGVLALEVLQGKHPGDFISTLTTLAIESIELKDILDTRLSPPSAEVNEAVMCIAKLAIGCLQINPESRPSMQVISQIFSTRKMPLNNL
ncbi:unnamed protein product [Thlaspi arvense]|uniref:non-specific serine/threonine protein kinase n=1 Tax=Thlaspi arvense TaxID=13288 RepID=A0AAU9RWL5_THLAR|nr:unnamed protein product [Thlaspi arvense]